MGPFLDAICVEVVARVARERCDEIICNIVTQTDTALKMFIESCPIDYSGELFEGHTHCPSWWSIRASRSGFLGCLLRWLSSSAIAPLSITPRHNDARDAKTEDYSPD